MRGVLFAVLVLSAMVPASVSVNAAAKSCSDRQKICFDYCAKAHARNAGCASNCADSMQKCVVDGCWTSKLLPQQCGLAKQ